METAGTPLSDTQLAVKREVNTRMNELAGKLSMAEDKLKQMFGFEEGSRSSSISPELLAEMRKEADEEEDFYDQTTTAPVESKEKTEQFKVRAKDQSYDELKRNLEQLLAEKAEANEHLSAIAQAERKAAQDPQATEDLDKLVNEDARALRSEKRASLVERIKTLVTEIDE